MPLKKIGLAIQLCTLFIIFNICLTEVLWECSEWNADDILAGCNWGTADIIHGSEGLAVVEDPSGESSQNALRVFFPNGSRAGGVIPKGGAEWLGRPFAGQNRATLSYEIYIASNFDFVKGGKFPGLFGGNGTCAGGITGACFSTRHMWRRDGDGEIYGYIPNEKDDWFCNNPDVVCNFEKGHSFGRGSFRFDRGRWQKIAQYIQLNDPGSSNGLMRIFFDGRQMYEISGLTFRNDDNLMIDAVFFSTFFGGSDDSWASTTDTFAYFRNFKVEI